MEHYILALDQGTTSSRAILFDNYGTIISMAQKEFNQYYPKPGWVEHDANEIWATQAGVAAEAIAKANLNGSNIAAIGITNQRETTVLWHRETGRPIYNAIVWQDRRTAEYCDALKDEGLTTKIQEKTGLILDSYFSATKMRWILDHVEGARALANEGKLAFGTIDTWLLWNLTQGAVHITDVSNASRTLLFNINSMSWDDELLEIFNIPYSVLPEVRQSSEVYGCTKTSFLNAEIPVTGIAGDQQAALFGQMCINKGMVKNTYGTGCFMLMNIGETPVLSKNNLLTTVAWKINGKTNYALEGSVFIAGAVVQWLRDGLGIIQSSSDVERLASQVKDSDGLYLVPAFSGLGAPYWNQYARGNMVGITRGTTAAHIARAALEAIAYQSMDVLNAMQADSGIAIKELRVDGGASLNNTLMQFQSDIVHVPVVRPMVTETTALGAAYLAGLAIGYWNDIHDISKQWQISSVFNPKMELMKIKTLTQGWERAVKSTVEWANLK